MRVHPKVCVLLVLMSIAPILSSSVNRTHAASPATNVYVVSSSGSVPGASVGTSGTLALEADCNPGDVATGGGYHDTDSLTNYESQPVVNASGVPTGWVAGFTNRDIFGSHSGTTYVLCLSAPGVSAYVNSVAGTVPGPSTSGAGTLSLESDCNAGGNATGGGFNDGAGATFIPSSGIFETKPTPSAGTPTGWISGFSDFEPFTSHGATTYVVCLTSLGVSDYSVTNFLGSVSAVSSQSVTASCNTPDLAVGGGFSVTDALIAYDSVPATNSSGAPVGWTGGFTNPDPTTSHPAMPVVVCLGQLPAWKQGFQNWTASHCTGSVPEQHLNVAFILVKYLGDSRTPLPLANATDRVEYIKDYYFQQSMCSVVINPTIASNSSAADGRFILPRTEAQYNAIPPDGANNFLRAGSLWTDAYNVWMSTNPTNKGPFDTIVVIDTDNSIRSRAFITEDILNRIRLGVFGLSVVLAAILGPVGVGLDGLIAGGLSLTGPLFAQASVISSDGDGTETWAHELGHALFTFWDFYGTVEPFVRGNIIPWDLMSNPKSIPPPPISVYNRQQAGWLQYRDISSTGTYSLTRLEDMSYGSQVLRFTAQNCVLFVCTPIGPVDWYVFELRKVPDAVPRAPEQSAGSAPTLTPQIGLNIYEVREVRTFLGIPTRVPHCGGLFDGPLLALGLLVDHDYTSCLYKINNVNLFGSQNQATDNPTLLPNTCYTDDIVNFQFCLSTDATQLTISDAAVSRNVISLESTANITSGGFPSSIVGPTTDMMVPRADLHLTNTDGTSDGPNYSTGNFDLNIAGSRAGGAYTTGQWISVPDYLPVSYSIDASKSFADAMAHGITGLTINATIFIVNYDANGMRTMIQQPIVYTLDFNHQKIGPIRIQAVQVKKYFTDGNNNPLPLDSRGNPMVNIVLSGGRVRSTNPGQVVAWISTTNTGSVSLLSLKLTESLPVDWIVAPGWIPGQGAIHAYFVFVNGSSPEITGHVSISVTLGNPETVTLAIGSINDTIAGVAFTPGDRILLSVKMAYGLIGTTQSSSSYPRNYTDTANAAAWTSPNYLGSKASQTGAGFFIAHAKVVGSNNDPLSLSPIFALIALTTAPILLRRKRFLSARR